MSVMTADIRQAKLSAPANAASRLLFSLLQRGEQHDEAGGGGGNSAEITQAPSLLGGIGGQGNLNGNPPTAPGGGAGAQSGKNGAPGQVTIITL